MTPYQFLLNTVDRTKTDEELYMYRFAGTYLNIEFVQQLAALFCDRVKILLQQVAGERSHGKKEFCASITLYRIISNSNN